MIYNKIKIKKNIKVPRQVLGSKKILKNTILKDLKIL